MIKNIKFTRIAGWIATVIGTGAILQGIGLVSLMFDTQIQTAMSSVGYMPGYKVAILFLGLTLINFGQLFVGIRILKGKENARQAILAYQLFYAVFMEIFNVLMIPNNDFINNYGFLGVLILPVLISSFIFIGRKEELLQGFKVV